MPPPPPPEDDRDRDCDTDQADNVEQSENPEESDEWIDNTAVGSYFLNSRKTRRRVRCLARFTWMMACSCAQLATFLDRCSCCSCSCAIEPAGNGVCLRYSRLLRKRCSMGSCRLPSRSCLSPSPPCGGKCATWRDSLRLKSDIVVDMSRLE